MFRHADSEHGASALLVAASLLLLVGMASMAVDLGAAFNEDRQDQTAADLAVVAGALEFVSPDAPGGARDAVLEYVRDNLDTTFSDAEYQAIWETCTDPAKPSNFNAVAAPSGWSVTSIDCISGSTSELRVRVPDQLVETSFGKVLGVNELAARAVAQADMEWEGEGAIRPFGLLNGVGAGTVCATTAPSGTASPPCDGADSGNFGTVNSQTWGLGGGLFDTTYPDCTEPGDPELAQNIAMGVDHPVGWAPTFPGSGGPYASFPSATTRLDACTYDGTIAEAADLTPSIGPVNTLRANTGFSLFQATEAGILSGIDADFPNAQPGTVTPLLQQVYDDNGAYRAGVFSTRDLSERVSSTVYDYEVDNTPLWMHLRDWSDLTNENTNFGLLVTTCRKSNYSSLTPQEASTMMSDCLAGYENLLGTYDLGPLFDDTIGHNPRFGWVPQFHFTTWGSGAHWQPVLRYRMVYFDTIWFNCNGSFNDTKNDEACTGTKGLTFIPAGPGDESALQVGSGASMRNLRLDQMTAFLIPDAAISQTVVDMFPLNIRGPYRIRLTR